MRDKEEFKKEAIKILGTFGLPGVPSQDCDFSEVLARVENESTMAEDLHKSLSDLLDEWEA